MQERNVISGTVAMFFSPFIEDYKSLLIWLVVAVVLILVDLRFGVSAAKKRGEKMQIIGIICEYSPFHNGHIYHIEEIKKKYPSSLIILCLI